MAQVGEQIAALPLLRDKKGKLKVLMVTSRDTGRWVMPKGWEMDGEKPWQAAAIEALEEAGAEGYIGDDILGTYRYPKILKSGEIMPVVVRVYPMVVEKLRRDWKERKQRTRRWFSIKAAAKRVDEPDLAELILGLETLEQLETKPIRKALNRADPVPLQEVV